MSLGRYSRSSTFIERSRKIYCPLTFIIHPQIGRLVTFDAYRLSSKSYAEHSWELGPKGPAKSRPLPPQIRRDLWDLFRLEADEPTRSNYETEHCVQGWVSGLICRLRGKNANNTAQKECNSHSSRYPIRSSSNSRNVSLKVA